MNTPVSFELAKLLNKKNQHVITHKRYTKDGFIQKSMGSGWSIGAPTIAEVVMRLYEKHGIWISSEPFIKNDNSVVNIYKIFKEGIIDTISRGSLGYDSPTEAYEAAIEYTLKNLI